MVEQLKSRISLYTADNKRLEEFAFEDVTDEESDDLYFVRSGALRRADVAPPGELERGW